MSYTYVFITLCLDITYRYTWRHDNILRYICENVDSENYQLNADIDGNSQPGGGTISPDPCVTPERTEIGIHDRLTNEQLIFELTVLSTRN